MIGPYGIQLGYINDERAPYIGARMSRGEEIIAIFQGIEGGSAFVRVRFGGGASSLPSMSEKHPVPAHLPRPRRRMEVCDPYAFYPDEEGPEFGA